MSCCNSSCNHDPCGSSFNQLFTKAAQYAQYTQSQAVAAKESEEAAEAAQVAAEAAAAQVEGFESLYLGAKDVPPAVDNEGNPLQEGALYFNTVIQKMYVWDGTNWITASNVTGFNEATNFLAIGSITPENLQDRFEDIDKVKDFPSYNFLATGTTEPRNLQDRFADVVNVLDFGADPTGAVDSTVQIQAALNAAQSKHSTALFPSGKYLVSNTLEVRCNTKFNHLAYIQPTGFPQNGVVFNILSNWLVHYNISIIGNDVSLKSNDVQGIKIGGELPNILGYNNTLYSPYVRNLGFGIVNRIFHTDIYSPRIIGCKTGISASAPSSNPQINLFRVFGGVLSDSDDYATYIGDDRLQFPTTLPANGQHGSTILFDGTQFMGTSRFRNVTGVLLNAPNFEYVNGLGNKTAIEIVNHINGFVVNSPYYDAYEYGIKCEGVEIAGLNVISPSYNDHTKCGLYVSGDKFPYTYTNPRAMTGNVFSEAPEIHTGQRQLLASFCLLDEVSIPHIGITNGVQINNSEPSHQYPSARYFNGSTTYSNNLAYGRRYKTPTTNIAGTLGAAGTAVYQFTLNNPSDAKFFNAGDKYSITGGFFNGVINRVDYENGILNLSDAFSSTPSPQTISQDASVWV